jgi:hypothetical protein
MSSDARRIAELESKLSSAWAQARVWRAERDAKGHSTPAVQDMDAKLSAAWAQARVWRAERDEARKMQTNEAIHKKFQEAFG